MFKNQPIGTKGFTCARCGRDYPIAARVYQQGLPVCTVLPCLDRDYPKSLKTWEEKDVIEEEHGH